MNALVLQRESRCPKAKNKPSFEGEPLPATAVVPCDEGERWTRLENMWDRDNGGDILEKLRRFWINLPRFLENLPRFCRNVRDNFFFVGPFLEPFVEVFEREEMADER